MTTITVQVPDSVAHFFKWKSVISYEDLLRWEQGFIDEDGYRYISFWKEWVSGKEILDFLDQEKNHGGETKKILC